MRSPKPSRQVKSVHALLISLLCLLIVPSLAPFVHKVRRMLTLVIPTIFVSSITFAWVNAPFTGNSRLKVFYAHQVELMNLSATTASPDLTHACDATERDRGLQIRTSRRHFHHSATTTIWT